MLALSYTAGERLDLLLSEASAPDDAATRLVLEGDGFSLKIDTPRPGDTTFDHAEKVVLAIDEQLSELLADVKLDVQVTGELVLIVPLEK